MPLFDAPLPGVRTSSVCVFSLKSIGQHVDLLTSVKRRKLKWYGHVTRSCGLPRLSYKEQFKEVDEEADKGNDRKTTSKSGLALNGISYYGKLRTFRSGRSWL